MLPAVICPWAHVVNDGQEEDQEAPQLSGVEGEGASAGVCAS